MNIVLDFTVNKSIENLTAGQELAVLPAALAKRLLKAYAEQLQSATSRHIIGNFRDSIDVHGSVDDSVMTAISYVQERDLIQNIVHENWDAYKVVEPVVA